MNRIIIKSSLLYGLLTIAGCGASNPPEVSDGHLMFDEPAIESIPEPVARVPVLPKPEQRPDLETYTVVVNGDALRKTGPAAGAWIGNKVRDHAVQSSDVDSPMPSGIVAVLAFGLTGFGIDNVEGITEYAYAAGPTPVRPDRK